MPSQSRFMHLVQKDLLEVDFSHSGFFLLPYQLSLASENCTLKDHLFTFLLLNIMASNDIDVMSDGYLYELETA